MTKSYAVAPGGPRWELAELDKMLEDTLPQGSNSAFWRKAREVTAETERGHRPDGDGNDPDLVRRMLWGLAVKYPPYAGPGPFRTSREGLKFTATEVWVIRTATTTTSALAAAAWRQHGKPDAVYLANLLQRSVPEVRDAITKYGPAQGRRSLTGQ